MSGVRITRSLFLKSLKSVLGPHNARFVSRANNTVSLPQEINEALESSEMKHRRHPGVRKNIQVSIPDKLLAAATEVLATRDIGQLREAASILRLQLWTKCLPTEDREVRDKAQALERQLLGDRLESMTPEERSQIEDQVEQAVLKKLKEQIPPWRPLNYDEFGSYTYLVGRLAADYATIRAVLAEIRHQNPAFAPKSLLDFGSGIGTSFWATREFWPHELQEYFAVDVSDDMNTLARLLVQGGNPNAEVKFRGYYQRQFLPATHKIKFDLVTSAFSLLELPSTEHRLQTVASLWGKTNSMLVLIENGTLEGHRAVLEARDFILTTTKKEDPEGCGARVLAPCPHDQDCPRETEGFGIPCNFQARYEEPFLLQKKKSARLNYSYVVLQRSGSLPAEHDWARLIRPVLCRSNHVVCRVCCHDAKLREFVFTKARHGRHIYRVARCSEWGDQLPVSILPSTEETMQESK
ncbi:methyltransferase-like protein 17, mitochondrial [Ixodes scapularis]|uniref:methyltransferase-like protein 17, mitochondrial n=1 Tax=Ixodes scapularis TaxID=6945 RepID=UPI001C38F7A5|nr:methyltransferase-like protein 17, mitochondrial [Ixodes scapularis]